jgi:lipopolysaccharide/colanic/teichoic acid biosynthesis glycosyltransferase
METGTTLFDLMANEIAQLIFAQSLSMENDQLVKVLTSVRSPLKEKADIVDLVFEIGERSGVLVRNSEESGYRFTHRALFEVLVARDLIDRGEEAGALAKADDDVWSETLAYLVELSRDVLPLLDVLRPGSAPTGRRLRLFGQAIIEARLRGNDVEASADIFSSALMKELQDERYSAELCALAWRIAPARWKAVLMETIGNNGNQIPKSVALKFMASVDCEDFVGLLEQIVTMPGHDDTKAQIADALDGVRDDRSERLLWILAAAGGRSAIVARELLARRGGSTIKAAESILQTQYDSPYSQSTAVQILGAMAASDARALAVLLDLVDKCEPNLHFLILQAIQSVHLKKLGREEALDVVGRIVTAKTFYAVYGKRILDTTTAMIMSILVLPIGAVLALAVRLSSPGPLVFRQARVGRDNKVFRLYKFRTMYADSEAHSGPRWASALDPRVTLIGRFMRKYRLDELPQLINVVRGELSLVGPRPEVPYFEELLSREIPMFGELHRVAPGITGLAQVEWRYGASLEDARQKFIFDLYYVSHLSFLLDLRILARTVKQMLTGSSRRHRRELFKTIDL